VTGFIRSYQGSIEVNGQAVDRMAAHRRAHAGVRRSFQQGRTIPDLTVEQYLRLGLTATQNRALGAAELDDLLSFFGCPGPRTRVADIDVGTRRLLEVAETVAAKPAIVLLDEPAAGLAGADSVSLAQRIADIPARYGPAVLLVEHDIELVSAAATHAVVLDFGKVIASGPPLQVLADRNVIGAYLGEEVAV
jgi:branched-chain amino acid transport system permease protein